MGKHLEHDVTVKVLPCSLQTHFATYLSRLETFLISLFEKLLGIFILP